MRVLFIAIFSILFSSICIAQEITPAPEDKAVVYFVRTTSMGFAINFSYFDSTRLIGKFNGPKYIRYECEPGPHLFWARSENRDFIEAEVEAGKIYFIEANVKMGAVKAGVQLLPISPTDPKKIAKIMKLIKKQESESFTMEEIANETQKLGDVIQRGLEKYNEEKAKGKTNVRLEKTMHYTSQ